MTEQKWIAASDLTPHPHNMRSGTMQVDEIVSRMEADGYNIVYPMLVRPMESGYQIIGGHRRHEAAKTAGIDEVFCVVKEMTDDEATLAIGEDNQREDPPWYDLCLYVANNAQKGKHGGLSRQALVEAATGKTGNAANADAKRYGAAGDVLKNVHMDVFEVDTNLTRQLAQIARLPQDAWAEAVDYLLDQKCTVKRITDEVKSALELLAMQPDWWKPISAIDALVRYRQVKPKAQQAKQALELSAQMGTVTIYQHEDTGEVREVDGIEYHVMRAVEEEYDQLADFKQRVIDGDNPDYAARDIYQHTQSHANSQQILSPVLTAEELEEKRLQEAEEAKRIAREAKAAQIHNGDCVQWLQNWIHGKIKLLLSDPPYGMAFQSNRRVESGKADTINADADYAEAMQLTANMLDAAWPNMADDSHLILFCNDEGLFKLRGVIEAAGFQFKRILVWRKANHTTGDLYGSFAPQKELAIHAVKGRPEVSPRKPDVYVQETKEIVTDHPTEKPVSLLSEWIECTTETGDTIVDPFMGTGATAVAGEEIGRRVYGAEMDDSYYAQAVERLLGVHDELA